MNFYTGIGSRKTPNTIMVQMYNIANTLAMDGKWTLRSGGASGADAAFESGCDVNNGNKEVFLPWEHYNNSISELTPPSTEAFNIAKRLYNGHPWRSLSDPIRALMARNVHQVLGHNLDTPSTFLICWTPDGSTKLSSHTNRTGGTRLAISIAEEWEVPIINLKNGEFNMGNIESYLTTNQSWEWQ